MLNNRLYRRIAFAMVLAALASGCGQDMKEDSRFELSGAVRGTETPAAAEATILFLVDENGGGFYKHGDGSSVNSAFSVTMDQEPPPAAYVDDSGLAVAWVALYEPGYTLPDGPLTQAQVDPITGISARFAIIWKADESSGAAQFPWADRFPAGVSCGVCARDDSPHGYEPVACSDFEVDAGTDGSTFEWCNWLPEI